MGDRKLLAFYGLKYNPFLPSVPVEDLYVPSGADNFLFRVETLVMDGGFALITGDPGLGKSRTLHLVSDRLSQVEGVAVRDMERPTSMLGDFYRELGHLFGLSLSVANRYGSFRALRDRWRGFIRETMFRPVLLIDEAQETAAATLNELRILGSERFDSEHLLTVVLCGDARLTTRFRSDNLLPLGSRIRTRLHLQPWSKDDLSQMIDQLLQRAGAPALLTPGLRATLVDHAGGNPRTLCTMANELLETALHRKQATVDEGLFLELYDRTPRKSRRQETRA